VAEEDEAALERELVLLGVGEDVEDGGVGRLGGEGARDGGGDGVGAADGGADDGDGIEAPAGMRGRAGDIRGDVGDTVRSVLGP
jgi:hypothetical protein